MTGGVEAFWGWPTPDATEPGQTERLTEITAEIPAAHLGLWVVFDRQEPGRWVVTFHGPHGPIRMIGGGTEREWHAFRVQAEFVHGPGMYRAVVLDSDSEELLAEAPIRVSFRS